MTPFTVTWRIDVEADTARDAALIAREVQLDPASQGTEFAVAQTGQVDTTLVDIGPDWPVPYADVTGRPLRL